MVHVGKCCCKRGETAHLPLYRLRFPHERIWDQPFFVGVKVWNPFPEVIQGETNANCCVWLQNHLDSCRIPPSQSFDECVLVMVSIRFKSVYKQSVYQKQFSELARKCYPVPWMRLNSQARISKPHMGMYGYVRVKHQDAGDSGDQRFL